MTSTIIGLRSPPFVSRRLCFDLPPPSGVVAPAAPFRAADSLFHGSRGPTSHIILLFYSAHRTVAQYRANASS